MMLIACSAAAAVAGVSTPAGGQQELRQGRWETTEGQRNMHMQVGNSKAAAGRNKGPHTTVSICSGGPLPGNSPPRRKGCEVMSYKKGKQSVQMTTRCRWRDGWREEVTTMKFNPTRYAWQTYVTVHNDTFNGTFEEYGTSRWLGPCK